MDFKNKFVLTLGFIAVSGIFLPGHAFAYPYPAASTYPTAGIPVRLVASDLTGDGKPDIAVLNAGITPGKVSIFINNGDGTLSPKVDYSAQSLALDLKVADLNNDNRPDIVVSNNSSASKSLSVFINNGNGTFAPAVNYGVLGRPRRMVIADFNNDGFKDIAVILNGGFVRVLLNNGDGTFPAGLATSYNVGAAGDVSTGIRAADFNNDGKLDLAIANQADNTISVLLNNGNGTFPAVPTKYAAGTNPQSLFAGDLNGDGKADIAVTNFASNSVSVFINNGNGTFAPAVNYGTGASPQGLDVGDLNGDGFLDFITPNNPDGTASVLLNNGNGTFAPTVNYPLGIANPIIPGEPLNTNDLDLDGDQDYIAGSTTAGSTNISVLLNNGSGTFASAVLLTAGNGAVPGTVADLRNDGHKDLAIMNFNANTISIFLSNAVIVPPPSGLPGGPPSSQVNPPASPLCKSCDGSTCTFTNNATNAEKFQILTNDGIVVGETATIPEFNADGVIPLSNLTPDTSYGLVLIAENHSGTSNSSPCPPFRTPEAPVQPLPTPAPITTPILPQGVGGPEPITIHANNAELEISPELNFETPIGTQSASLLTLGVLQPEFLARPSGDLKTFLGDPIVLITRESALDTLETRKRENGAQNKGVLSQGCIDLTMRFDPLLLQGQGIKPESLILVWYNSSTQNFEKIDSLLSLDNHALKTCANRLGVYGLGIGKSFQKMTMRDFRTNIIISFLGVALLGGWWMIRKKE